jgi:hypothetical protein
MRWFWYKLAETSFAIGKKQSHEFANNKRDISSALPGELLAKLQISV